MPSPPAARARGDRRADGRARARAVEPEPVTPAHEPEPVVVAAPVTEPEPVEQPDATARLDAAVERANAAPVASDPNDVGDADVPAPVAADSVRRETYVPAATVAAGTAAGAATLAPEPDAVPAALAAPADHLRAGAHAAEVPRQPRLRRARRAHRHRRVRPALRGRLLPRCCSVQRDAVEAGTVFAQFVVQPVFWVPIVACFLGFALLAAIVNRGPGGTTRCSACSSACWCTSRTSAPRCSRSRRGR